MRRRPLLAVTVLLAAMAAWGCAGRQDGPIRDALRDRLEQRLPAAQPGPGPALALVSSGGLERSYYVHVPPGLAAPAPAVMLFHGGLGDGLDAERLSGLSAAAEAAGFVAILPNSAGGQWNDGRATTQSGIDDLAFVEAVLRDATLRHGVDPTRVFAAGMSNGGMFVQRLACERAELLRGAAVVAANMPADLAPACAPARPLPIAFFHGTADQIMPFAGGEIATGRLRRAGAGGAVLSRAETLGLWARAFGCRAAALPLPLPDRADDGTRASLETVSGCAGGVQIAAFTIEGGGHTWPGSQGGRSRLAGLASQDISATAEIVAFFRRYGL
jgi:polyhydroxybutyrate depolymerase